MGTPRRIPLVAPIESRLGTDLSRGLMKNVVVEKKGEGVYHTKKRPGLSQYMAGSAGVGMGITSFLDTDDTERLYAIRAGALYTNGSGYVTTSADYTEQWTSTTFGATDITQYANGQGCKHGDYLFYGWPMTRGGSYTPLNKLWRSSDGSTWTEVTTIPNLNTTYAHVINLFSCNGILIAFAATGSQDPSTTFTVLHSYDNGSSWVVVNAATGFSYPSSSFVLNVTAAGHIYIHTRNSSNGATVRYSTDNGATWSSGVVSGMAAGTTITSPPVYFNGRFYTHLAYTSAAYNSNIYSSTDGLVFASASATSGMSVNGVSINSCARWTSEDGTRLYYWLYDGAGYGFYVTSNGTTFTSLYYGVWAYVMGSLSDGGFGTETAYSIGLGRYFEWHGRAWCFDSDDDGATLAQANLRRSNAAVTGYSTSLGAVTGTFFDFGQTYNKDYLVVKSESAMYRVTIASNTVTAVSDVDYPASTVPGLAYVDGYFLVMDKDGNIYNSANEDCTSWNALDFIAAEFEPDNGKAIVKVANYVCAIGTYSTEFFFDASNATGSPFSAVQNGVFNVGCAEGRTVMPIEGGVFFVAQRKGTGQSLQRGRFVAVLTGLGEPQRVSTPDIDRIIDKAVASTMRAAVFSVNGHSFYSLYMPSIGTTLVYDVTEKLWHVWKRRVTSFTANPVNPVMADGTATWVGSHSFSDGDPMVVTAFTSTNTVLNGTFNATVPASGTLCWPATISGTATGTGTATGWVESGFDVVGGCAYAGKQLLQGATDGDVYELSNANTTDTDVYIDSVVRTSNIDEGALQNKFVAYVSMIGDRSTGTALYRQSDNDGSSYTMFRGQSMDQEMPRFNRCGRFRRRMMEFRVTDPYTGAIEAAEISYGD